MMFPNINQCFNDCTSIMIDCKLHGSVSSCAFHDNEIICMDCCKQAHALAKHREQIEKLAKQSCYSYDMTDICYTKCVIHGNADQVIRTCDIHYMIKDGAITAICLLCCKSIQDQHCDVSCL